MKKIAIICGGYSGEYDISVQTAKMVQQNLDSSRYETYLIYIESTGWYALDAQENRIEIDRSDFSLPLSTGKVTFEGIFNAIHGTPGEDGVILGYFDLLGIPYTSCSMEVSALTFNKYLFNVFAQATGVRVARSFNFTAKQLIDRKEVIDTLGLPVFIKPTKSGSSVGVSRVESADEFDAAVAKAFAIDDRILIEEFLDGREFACGLYQDGDELIVMPLAENVSKNAFFDYEAKYTPGFADEICPAQNVPADQEALIKETSRKLYEDVGCQGLVRIDYMLTEKGLFLIELNSIPGLSPASIVIKQAAAMDLTNAELFNTLLDNLFTA